MGGSDSKPLKHSATPRNPKSHRKTQNLPKIYGKQEKPLELSVERSHQRHGPDDKRLPAKASGNTAHPPQASGKTAHPPKASGKTTHPPQASGHTAHPSQASGKTTHPSTTSGNIAHPPQASGKTAHPSTSGKTSKALSFRDQPAEPSSYSPPELTESPSPSEESTEEQQSEDEENQMEIPQAALTDVLRCNICFETLVQPRTLPCQHNYCHACLAKYIRIHYRDNLLFKRRKVVVCPVCRTPGAVPNPDLDPDGKDWAEQFRPGLAIQQLLDARVPVSKGRKDANRTTSLHKSFKVKASLPLHRACQEGQLDVVKEIISEGKTDINSRDMTVGGQTPVMTAAWYGQNAVCAYLIKQGCDLSAVDEDTNLLHCACFGGDLNTVKTLTKKKIFHINIMDTFNKTPIMFAAAGGHVDVFTYLTNMGCDVTGVDVYNNNILHAACESGNVEMVKHVISLNVVDKESRGEYGRTPLMYAAGYGHLELFNFLVSTGCDMRAVEEYGNNILHVACIGGNVEMVKHILSLNVVDKGSRGQYGRTPIMRAAELGHLELFRFLVNTGCDMRAVEENGNNILHVACIGGNVEMVKHILSLNVVDKESMGYIDQTPLLTAAKFGHIGLFKFLLAKGCNITARTKMNGNVLHLACVVGEVDMVKHLMSIPAVRDMIHLKTSDGETAADVAQRTGHRDIVALLRED